MQGALPLITLCSFAVTVVAAADVPAFEVASVKASSPDARGGGFRPTPGGRLVVSNLSLESLIFVAYKLQPYQVVGGPGWVRSEHFDIAAKADGNPTRDQMLVLVQGLLAERFKLASHREMKEMSTFVLTAKTNTKSGSGMHPTDEKECPPKTAGPEPEKKPQLACGGVMMNFSPAGVVLNIRGGTMAQLVSALQNRLAAPVVNETGLEGRFDIKLEFAMDMNGPAAASAAQRGPANALPPPPNGPSLFTAIQEQLGLRLDSRKAPVGIFVIDHAERPSEN